MCISRLSSPQKAQIPLEYVHFLLMRKKEFTFSNGIRAFLVYLIKEYTNHNGFYGFYAFWFECYDARRDR